jgi:hypothetical protein
MKIPDEWNEHPAFGEAQMVLGPLDIPAAEEIEGFDYGEDDFLLFRWNNNAVTMMFEGNMVVSISYRHKAADGSITRYGADFFITDPVPQVFFENIKKSTLTGLTNK